MHFKNIVKSETSEEMSNYRYKCSIHYYGIRQTHFLKACSLKVATRIDIVIKDKKKDTIMIILPLLSNAISFFYYYFK